MAHSENITMQRPSREFFENNKGATRCEWGPNTKTKCKIIQMIVAEVAVQRRGCYWMIGSATIVKFLPNIFIFAVVLRTKRQFVLPLWANPNHIAKYYLLIGQGQASSRITQLLLVSSSPSQFPGPTCYLLKLSEWGGEPVYSSPCSKWPHAQEHDLVSRTLEYTIIIHTHYNERFTVQSVLYLVNTAD